MNTFDNIARTQWFYLWLREDVTKDIIPGVYEVRYFDASCTVYYSYFDGGCWYKVSTTPKGALDNRVTNLLADAMFIAFRGLAENPNKSSTEIIAEPWVDPKLEHLKEVADDLYWFEGLGREDREACIEAAENIIRELIQSIESIYETVA